MGDLGPVPHPEAVLDEHEAVLVPHQVEQVHRITDDVEEEPRGQGLEALLFYFQWRPFHHIFLKYRESLKGSSQVVRISGGKIVFSCLQEINITQLSHLISYNLGSSF